MSDEINYYGWDFLRHDIWPLEKPQEQVADLAVTRSSSRKSAMAALAVTLGLTVGAFALYWWRRDRIETELEIDAPPSEPYEYVDAEPPEPVEYEPVVSPRPSREPARARQPWRQAVWLPQTGAHFETLSKAARTAAFWIADPEAQLKTLWGCFWRGVPLPTTPHPHDHSSVAQAVTLVRMALDTARAERAAERQQAEPQLDPASAPVSDFEKFDDPEESDDLEELDDSEQLDDSEGLDDPEALDDAEVLTCEVPRPGHFFCVRAGDELLGDGGIATGALLVEAMIAGCERGWDRQTVETHATKLAATPQARAAYAALIRQSEWNAARLDPLVEGTLLWLPPLEQLPLGGPNQPLRIALEPQAWSDGSLRLEPPPQLRQANHAPAPPWPAPSST